MSPYVADNLKIQVASVKSRIERLIKTPGFDAKEAASLKRHLEELNQWTQEIIQLPEESSGSFLTGISINISSPNLTSQPDNHI